MLITFIQRALLLSMLFTVVSCKPGAQDKPATETYSDAYKTESNNPEFIHAGTRRIIDIIRHDIFAPPIASRIYAYSSIAGYEALVPGYPEYQSLAGTLNGLAPTPQPEAGKDYCFPLAGVNAMLIVGKALVFSEGEVDSLKEQVFEDFKKMNMPPDVYERSMKYGDQVAKHILAWSKKDNYSELRSAPRFNIDTDDPARWQPTPPAYDQALEPHWRSIRPWTLDSAAQFRPEPPVAFSTAKGSEFYKQAYEVYQIGKRIAAGKSSKDSLVAWYWDDNPFALQVSGHLSFGRKKISPAGHWMNIASIACRQAKLDVMPSAETYVKVACATADAFISCWDEKYRSNLVRPETFINKYIDPEWRPLIQTPPFPEHTSGHSTVSSAAAMVLTQQFGEKFAFTDSTEVEFGLPARSFKNFLQAADEVGISRLYGGIHYRRGNQAGLKAGRAIGKYVSEKLNTRKSAPNN